MTSAPRMIPAAFLAQVLAAVLSVGPLLPSGAAAKTKLAVMSIRDQTRSLGRDLSESLTDALRTQLAQSGRFIVIDKSRQARALERLVAEQKRDSYRTCYDERCQIPLGQALAADTILRTQVTRVGSFYLINAELVDLAKEAVTGAAQTRVKSKPRKGRDDRLLRGLSNITWQLTGTARHRGGVGLASGFGKGGTADGTLGVLQGRREPTPEEQEAARRRSVEQEEQRRELQARRQREAEQRSKQWAVQRAEQKQRYEVLQRQRAEEYERKKIQNARLTRGFYGWTGVISGGILAASGIYYLTAKVGDAEERANQATSSSALSAAADEAEGERKNGIWLVSIGGAVIGLGAYLLLTLPELKQTRTSSVSVAPSRGGLTLGWSGRF